MDETTNAVLEAIKDQREWAQAELETAKVSLHFSAIFDYQRLKYSYRTEGFLRCNIAGWRFVWIDTSKHHAIYSDRTHGLRIGRFIVRASRA